MNRLKKIYSYLFPISKTFESKISDTIQVTLRNGKKMLDSKNANYSYGLLQKVLTFGLSRIELKDQADILILGLGGGCVIESIEKRFGIAGKNITAIEIDSVIIQLAKEEFNLGRFKQLDIIQADAFDYVKKHERQFNLIVIDLYIDDVVPEQFYSTPFLKNISSLLKPKGKVLFNAGMSSANKERVNEAIEALTQNHILVKKYNNVTGINTILIGEKNNDFTL